MNRADLFAPDVAHRDALFDALLRFENHKRYQAQSAATVAGRPAPLPERAPLSLVGVQADFDRMFGVR